MPVTGLAHVALRCRDLDASARFYAEVIGLREGPRPDFGFPGRWLYNDAGAAIVHLFGAEDEAARRFTGSEDCGGSGVVDHIAFAATDWPAMQTKLYPLGIPFQAQVAPESGTPQVFLHDPDGVTVELSFDSWIITNQLSAPFRGKP